MPTRTYIDSTDQLFKRTSLASCQMYKRQPSKLYAVQ